MNTLERETIQRYRKTFPNETLKNTSEKTGIQITRVFRIMNGKPMKVRELEIFQQILNQKIGQNKQMNELDQVVKMAALDLTIRDIEKIISYIERKIENSKLLKQSITLQTNEDLIA